MFETKRPTNQAAEEILNLYFPVLDAGFVSIVDYMGTDQCIESAARVSYGAGTRKVSQTRGLIRYLRRHKHSTPSEMIELKFHICCPIFVMRQWIRHRMSSTNEYSGRYSLMPMLFYTPKHEQFQKQSKSNNQGRSGELDLLKYDAAVSEWNKIRKQNRALYEDLTSEEVARELARIDLPLSTYTQFYWKIDLHNLLHFLTLRVDSHAQWEIRQFGEIIAGMLKRVAPLSYEAWIDYDVCGARFSRMEMEIIQDYINAYDGEIENKECIEVMGVNEETIPFKNNEYGLSKRELKEFVSKLTSREVPDFSLNLSDAKSPEYFEKKMAAAVPNIDKGK